jgi:hypothetical protein
MGVLLSTLISYEKELYTDFITFSSHDQLSLFSTALELSGFARDSVFSVNTIEILDRSSELGA